MSKSATEMSPDELETYRLNADDKWRAETSTGFMCRQVLGFNHDRAFDPKNGQLGAHINVGTGGVRSDGPHGEMTRFADAGPGRRLLMAPRASYKSSIVQGRVIRSIVSNPNVRVALLMDTVDQVKEKAGAIRTQLTHNPIIVATWGLQQGPRWTETNFTVAGRTNYGLQEPTLKCFSTDKGGTGGHFELVIPDDMVNHDNVRTKDSRKKTSTMWEQLGPLLEPGGLELILGTHYHFADLYAEKIRPNEDYQKLILDAGVRLQKIAGKWELFGTAEFPNGRFPHQDLEFLRAHLRRGYTYFMTQYMNRAAVSSDSAFRAEQFRSISFDDLVRGAEGPKNLSGYILTDTAASDTDDACYGVVAYVVVDAAGRAYVVDVRCGRWSPNTFLDAFFNVLGKWQGVFNHRGELFEKIGLNYVYDTLIRDRARQRGFQINLMEVARQGGKNQHSKMERIKRLAPRCENGDLFIVDTVPRVFIDSEKAGDMLLFDPEGGTNPDGSVCPAGELIDEFVNLGSHGMVDIADCLADIEATDADTGERILNWVRPPQNTPNIRTENRGYATGRVDSSDDWMSRKARALGF